MTMKHRWLEAVIPPLLVLILWAILAADSAARDNFQCIYDTGCKAIMPVDGKCVTKNFKKGDIISTSSGWIVNPTGTGWRKIDGIAAVLFLPGCAP
jgi:hypothetical protein